MMESIEDINHLKLQMYVLKIYIIIWLGGKISTLVKVDMSTMTRKAPSEKWHDE